MQSRLNEQIPRFGWSRSTLIDDVDIGDGGGADPVVTPPVERPAGMFQAAVQLFIAGGGSAGTGTIGAILEGSNSGNVLNASEWFQIGSLNISNAFVAGAVSDEQRLMGNTVPSQSYIVGGSGNVNLGRFRYLRVRGEPLTGIPTYTMTVRMTGIAGDGEAFRTDRFLSSTSGSSNEVTTGFIVRPQGTRWMSVTSLLTAMVMDPVGGTGWEVFLEGALDQESADAGDFIGIGVVTFDSPTVGDAQRFNPLGLVMDMGPFNFFRFRTENYGGSPPSTTASFTFQININFDDNDWVDGETGLNELSSSLQGNFLQVVWGEPEAQGLNTVVVPGQMLDGNGVPVTSIYRVKIVVSDNYNDQDMAPSATATLTTTDGFGTVSGASIIGVQAGEFQGADDGRFEVTVDSNGTPLTYYLTAIPYTAVSQTQPAILSRSDVAVVPIT